MKGHTVGLSIIGAGFGRTGTLSLKVALESLGIKRCCHMFELVDRYDRVPLWVKAENGEVVDWNQVFEGFDATVDWPGANFYGKLAEFYPQAKVILTVRDPEQWYESTRDTIAPVMAEMARNPSLPHGAMMLKILRIFGGDFESREHCISVYNNHNEEVKQTIPAERLLVMNIADGWKPLCDFLSVPVPNTPFPRVNDRNEFQHILSNHMVKLHKKLNFSR